MGGMGSRIVIFAGMAEDRVIARIGDRTVMYGEVWCSREFAAAHPKWLGGKSVEEACVEYEREQFRALATRILVEKACAIEGCEPGDAEIEPFRSPILKDEAMLAKLGALARESFLRESDRFKPDVVERFLARDFVANARQHYEGSARNLARRAALRKHIERLGIATEDYLRSLIERVGVTILDPQFELPRDIEP